MLSGVWWFYIERSMGMAKKLYVGNLSNEVTDEDLKTHFAALGNVASATVIRDKLTGMGKGFGFVEMETEEAAREAIGKLNGTSLQGKTIVVNEARPKKDQGGPRRDSRGGGFRGGPGRMGGGGRRF
jgi:RNA recognition motif-containing protein